MPEHDFAVTYVEQDLGPLALTVRQQPSQDGRGIVISGHCPRCQGETHSEFRRGAPGTGTKGILARITGRESSPAREVLAEEVFFCECGYSHPQQPASPAFAGCGASWRVLADPSGAAS